MNGRTARRIVMASRTISFWGRRSYVGVRMPLPLCGLAAMPERFVDSRIEGDVAYKTVISVVSSGSDPRTRRAAGTWNELFGGPFFVRESAYSNGEKDYSWVEAREITYERSQFEAWENYFCRGGPKPTTLHDELRSRPLEEADCAVWRAEEMARSRVRKAVRTTMPVAYGEAQAVEIDLDLGPSPVAVFAVKWFEKPTLLRFSAGLAREVTALQRAGHAVRVLPGRFG